MCVSSLGRQSGKRSVLCLSAAAGASRLPSRRTSAPRRAAAKSADLPSRRLASGERPPRAPATATGASAGAAASGAPKQLGQVLPAAVPALALPRLAGARSLQKTTVPWSDLPWTALESRLSSAASLVQTDPAADYAAQCWGADGSCTCTSGKSSVMSNPSFSTYHRFVNASAS